MYSKDIQLALASAYEDSPDVYDSRDAANAWAAFMDKKIGRKIVAFVVLQPKKVDIHSYMCTPERASCDYWLTTPHVGSSLVFLDIVECIQMADPQSFQVRPGAVSRLSLFLEMSFWSSRKCSEAGVWKKKPNKNVGQGNGQGLTNDNAFG